MMNSMIGYHYTNLKALESILESQTIRLGSALTMDDPLDEFFGPLCAILYFTDKNLSELKKSFPGELGPDLILESFDKNLNVDFFSASFCQSYKNKTLWDTYANQGKGVAIGFDLGKILDYVNDVNKNFQFCEEIYLRLVEIQYGYKEIGIENEIERIIHETKTSSNKSAPPISSVFSYLWYFLAGKYKSKFWEEQQETRLLFKSFYRYNEEKLEKTSENNNEFIKLEKLGSEEMKEKLEELGLLPIKQQGAKKYCDLSLKEIWKLNIIPIIYVANEETKENVEKIIKQYPELAKTKVRLYKL